MATRDKLDQLYKKGLESKLSSDERRAKRQHAHGKLTARERIDLLVDPGTFEELDPFITQRAVDYGVSDERYFGDAVVTGCGKVNGRLVFVYAHDFTVFGGSISEAGAQKICKVMDLALKKGVPLVSLNDSGGARIQEGVLSLGGVGDILYRNTVCSGAVPQLSVVLGPCAGGAVYSPALTDLVFMVKGISRMYITGPDVIKTVTGEVVSHEELGGALAHARRSGVAHFVAENESDCFQLVRRVLSFLPQNSMEAPPCTESSDDPDRMDEELVNIVPNDPNKPYDMKRIIVKVVDNGEFLEVHQHYAPNIIVGFARLNGRSIGIVAQQPSYLAGIIDNSAAIKGARFIRFCDSFNLPLVSFVDVPGFMPGVEQEHSGIIKNGAKFIFSYAESTVPKISVIVRKAYGGAYIVMSSRHLRGDINYAWPTGEIAVMGSDGAVSIIYKDAITKSDNPENTKRKLIGEYEEKFANPYEAAARGYIDNVIDPRTTRPKLIKALEMLENPTDTTRPYKKHGNIPL